MNAKPLLASLLLLAGSPAMPAIAAVEPFYQSLLRDGQLAFDRKDYTTAARTLRLACFGMLDEPRPFTDCLVRLALAQDGAGQVEGFRETFQRLVEVEDRFKSYSQADLPPELRGALEARLAARLPAATLAGTPAFRSTQAKKGTAAAQAPGKGIPPTAATAPPPKPAPVPAQPAAAGPMGPPMPVNPSPPSAVAAKPAPAEPARPLSDTERKKLDTARQLLGAQRPSKELRQAFELARSVADAHPDSKEAQHLAAEGAYRISRWSDAATYFHRGGDPGEDEPERLFYMAVSLYESGDQAAAAAVLRRALPNLKRSTYVESYIHKILGPS
jgi:tetratricopeptide (TPR) repeat protein